MMTLQFILNLLNSLSLIFSILGIVLCFTGYKLIRIINMLFGFSIGSIIGYFIGFIFIMSETMAFLLGGILGLIFAFFAFAYYKYLKGLFLGFLCLILLQYTFLPSFIIFSLVISIGVAVITYKYEKILTIVLTSLLGSFLILYNIIGLNSGVLLSIISILLGICGLFIQLKIIEKRFPGCI